MKNLLKLCLLGYFLRTVLTLADSTLSVKLAVDGKSSEVSLCKSIESAIAEVKDELVEIKKEFREIKGKGLYKN